MQIHKHEEIPAEKLMEIVAWNSNSKFRFNVISMSFQRDILLASKDLMVQHLQGGMSKQDGKVMAVLLSKLASILQ